MRVAWGVGITTGWDETEVFMEVSSRRLAIVQHRHPPARGLLSLISLLSAFSLTGINRNQSGGDDAESEDEPPTVDDNDGSEDDDGCATGGTNDGSTDLPSSAAPVRPTPSSFCGVFYKGPGSHTDGGGNGVTNDNDDSASDGAVAQRQPVTVRRRRRRISDSDNDDDSDSGGAHNHAVSASAASAAFLAQPIHGAPATESGEGSEDVGGDGGTINNDNNGDDAPDTESGEGSEDVGGDGGTVDNDNNDDEAAVRGDDDDSTDDGAVARSQPDTVRRRRRRISDSDNDDNSDSGGAHGCAVSASADSAALAVQPDSASTASAASHAQPVYGYGVPDTGGHDDSDGADGAVAGDSPITSLPPIGMKVTVFTYGQRRPATITGHASNGDVEFKVFSTGVWRTWYETRPPSFFGIGPATPPDETTDAADQPDVDVADGLTATAAASPQRVWRGAATVTVLTNADESRARRLKFRQHQRDQSHLTDSRGSQLTDAQQIALALQRSTGPLASSPGDAASDDTHALDSDATAPPAAQETEFDNGEPGLRNEESLAVAMALSLSIANTPPASTQLRRRDLRATPPPTLPRTRTTAPQTPLPTRCSSLTTPARTQTVTRP